MCFFVKNSQSQNITRRCSAWSGEGDFGQRHAEALDGGLAFCKLVESPQIFDLCLTERYEHAIFKHCRSTSIINISK